MISGDPLFVLTVDAEEEWNWSRSLPSPPFSTRNIQRLPAFQDFCAETGLRPTYFVDAAVASVPENRAILQRHLAHDECDIGAQLHPWCTAPVDEPRSEFHSHTINLDIELAAAKVSTLTEMLAKIFGRHPFSFRCGRWGMNGRLMRVLADQGYELDASVRPRYATDHFGYEDASGGQPYWPSFDDVSRAGGQRRILELPVSDGFTRSDFDAHERLHRTLGRSPFRQLRARGLLWHLGLLRKIAMTPEGMSSADLCRCIDRHFERGNTVITLFMHSSDLLPGATPYVRDEADLKRFLATLRCVAHHVRTVHGARFVTVREAHSILMSRHRETTVRKADTSSERVVRTGVDAVPDVKERRPE